MTWNAASMTERAAAPRTSLSRTVLSIAALAAVAVALVWSALVAGALRKRSEATAAVPPTVPAHVTSPDTGRPAPTPAPVTTQTS